MRTTTIAAGLREIPDRDLVGVMRVLLCVLACCVIAALAAAPAAQAVIDDNDDTGPVEGSCPLSFYDFELEVNLVPVGLPIAGSPLEIDATSAKLVGRKATATRICDTLYFQVPKFEWRIAAVPPGQSAAIANAATLRPRVNFGGPGAYKIRLTSCPSKCTVRLNGKSTMVGSASRDITINAVTQLAPPPETEPLLPPKPLLPPPPTAEKPPPQFNRDQRDKACQGGGGAVDPQWVTAQRFNGPDDYRLVEGEVDVSKVSRQDSFLNHDSQDQTWDVEPDRPYVGLRQPFPFGHIEMEWETNAMPREVRPTAGDRASTAGFWIFDCGHGPFRTEIHPPVGVGVERPRAVEIPSSFRPAGPNGLGSNVVGLGSNVVVPGIVTDLWFNRRSGETTSNCSRTGLHQPSTGSGSGACIREPHRLGTFTFNVYLPRDPQLRARELGLNPPPVPLFVGIGPTPGLGSGGPDPTVAVKRANGATWLEVTVRLNANPGMTYARRVSAAWAYPQSDNWGARRWNVRLNKIDVGDDAEPPGDDGDWRFFFNTNNRDREWTRVFSCDGCIDDDETRNLNVQTGSTGLGPNLVLFPDQKIFVHTGGFDDEAYGDDIGRVFDRRPQVADNYRMASQGDEGSYTLDYDVRAGPPVGSATLTPQGSALIDAYTVKQPPQCVLAPSFTRQAGNPGVTNAPQCGRPVAPAQRDPGLTQTWHPDALVLTKSVQRGRNLELFETEVEEFSLQGISTANLERVLTRLRTKDPKRLNAFLSEIRQELGRIPPRLRNDYNRELVATLDKALPANFVRKALPPGFVRR